MVTGFRPDLGFLSEVRLDLDPALGSPRVLADQIHPDHHSCGDVAPHGHRELTQPEPGLYLVGMKSYGRAPSFLAMTGFEQVRSVVAALDGDLAAADSGGAGAPRDRGVQRRRRLRRPGSREARRLLRPGGADPAADHPGPRRAVTRRPTGRPGATPRSAARRCGGSSPS